ncbi:MAG TPA: phosphoglycerate mutase family protein [Bdellovibrionota bacterium]|nr:phosphoglycerate mutase family protein [Bdellovibrionota bacterium]
MTPTLLIVRHAHRDKSLGGAADNGLSAKGRKQSSRVLERFKEQFASAGSVKVLSSPKRRCMETVQPIAEHLGTKVRVEALLDEGENLELRAKKFLQEWKKDSPELLVICSHGDWIPCFLEFATGVQTDLAKGGWVRLENRDGRPVVTEILQEL